MVKQRLVNVSLTSCLSTHLGDMHIVPNLARGDQQVKSEMSREFTRSNSGGPLSTPNTSTHNSGLILQ